MDVLIVLGRGGRGDNYWQCILKQLTRIYACTSVVYIKLYLHSCVKEHLTIEYAIAIAWAPIFLSLFPRVDEVWESGIWVDEVWESGIWVDEVWELGIWVNEVWESGIWVDEVWESGIWVDEVWESGMWVDEVWESGMWVDEVWESLGSWELSEQDSMVWRKSQSSWIGTAILKICDFPLEKRP
jgi:hypothetical protein